RLADMTVTLQDTLQPLTIDVAADDEHAVQVIYNPADSTITLDRTCSGGPTTKYDTCAFSITPENGQLKLRFIMDRYSLELFVNDGQQAATITYYTPQEADRIQFHAETPVQIDVEFYPLKL
ncbi:MAG: GH32 C-terminal domain-containing protein, partial [Firmicutes bacterium]|nr:GH32 C-terminal domain-containing protein [Bacillota bacterium]